MRLQDKVAIVTGGGGGMGRGISHCLSREGADVVVADLNLAGAQATVEVVEKIMVILSQVVSPLIKQTQFHIILLNMLICVWNM